MEPIYSFDITKYSLKVLKPAIITRLIENRVIYSQLLLASREPHCLRALWHTVSSPLHYWLPICTFVTLWVCICMYLRHHQRLLEYPDHSRCSMVHNRMHKTASQYYPHSRDPWRICIFGGYCDNTTILNVNNI